MNGFGNQLLTRSALPCNQDCGLMVGHFFNELKDPCHGFASGHDVSKGILLLDLVYFVLQSNVFLLEAFPFLSLFQGQKDFIVFERL